MYSFMHNVLMFMLYCKTLLLLLRRDIGQIRDRFSGMVRLKVGLSGRSWFKSEKFKTCMG